MLPPELLELELAELSCEKLAADLESLLVSLLPELRRFRSWVADLLCEKSATAGVRPRQELFALGNDLVRLGAVVHIAGVLGVGVGLNRVGATESELNRVSELVSAEATIVDDVLFDG